MTEDDDRFKSSRISVNDGFHMLVKETGRAPEQVVKTLNEETGNDDGALDLWRNGTLAPRRYIRSHLCFAYDAATERALIAAVDPGEITLKGPLGGVLKKDTFELVAGQLEALIVNLTRAPKRRRRAQRELSDTVAREIWPPDGKPPDEMGHQEAIGILGAKVKARRKELKITAAEPSSTTLLRAIGRRP